MGENGVPGASATIIAAVSTWPGTSTHDGERGELSIRLGRRELGHLHGDRSMHASFPKDIWLSLYEEGRIDYHPIFPGKRGYAARRIESDTDVTDVIELLRINYDRAAGRNAAVAAARKEQEG